MTCALQKKPATVRHTTTRKKKYQEDCSLFFFPQRVLQKNCIYFVFYFHQIKKKNFKSKGVGTFPPLTFFHTQLIVFDTTIVMTSLSIGTNRNIGTNGPSELPSTQPHHMTK